MPFKLVTYSSLFIVSLSLALLGCGDKQSSKTAAPGGTVSASRPALEAKVPVLRWFPPEADLVAVAGSLQELLSTAEQLASLSPSLDLSPLGEHPFDANLWAERGAVASAPVGLFIHGATITAVLPTAEKGKLSVWARDNYQGQIVAATHKGHEVSNSEYGAAKWSWLEVDGYFVMHVGVASGPMAEDQTYAWLDDMILASQGSAYAGSQAATEAYAFRKDGEVWGSATPLALLGTVVGGTDRLACAGLLGSLSGMVFATSLQGQLAELRTEIQLEELDLVVLRGLLSPAASEGIVAQRVGAGAYASLAIDLQATGGSLRAAACAELAALIQDPLASVGWSPPPRAVHVAGTHFRVESLGGNVALDVALRNKRFINKQLDIVPGRSFFESSLTLEGTRVKRLSIPTMSSLYYHLSDQRLVFGTKKSIMVSLLKAPSQTVPTSSELLAVGIWPEKLPQLPTLLRQLIPQRDQRDLVAHLLSRLDHAASAATLKGNRLGMQFELKLRAGVTSLW